MDRLRQYLAILGQRAFGRFCNIDKKQAEELYDSGKEATVEKLLEYDREKKELKEKIAKLESSSEDSSKPPSSDSPQ